MKSDMKRATVYFDSRIHWCLRLKAAETDRSISDLVNEAVKLSLAEDAEDLAASTERLHEPNLAFEDVLKDLRKRGNPVAHVPSVGRKREMPARKSLRESMPRMKQGSARLVREDRDAR